MTVVSQGDVEAVTLESIPPPSRFGVPKVTGIPKGWSRAEGILDRVTAVRTIFPDFNRATRVGGLPTKRITTVHGPTHGGKSALVMGFLRSFIDGGDFGGLIDAEHTMGQEFAEELFERSLRDIPNLLAERPKSYEETIEKVDSFLNYIGGERKPSKDARGHAVPGLDVSSVLVIDSINKLVPERELAQMKASGDNIDKGWGRYRAALNQAWLDHLVPLIGGADCALVLIAQERESKDAKPWEIPHIKGGGAMLFDASVIARVMKSDPVFEVPSDKQSPIIGFRHKVRIWKSKVGHMDGRHSDCYFHMSNGVIVRPGFDTARDAVYVGRDMGVIDTAGSWLSWKKRRWQGENKMVIALTNDRDALHELLAEINARIDASIAKGGHS